MQIRKHLSEFIKRETVLCIAGLLAVVSVFFVPPDGEYAGYIDFRTLAVLFCLMCVVAGLQKLGVFEWIAGRLLGKVKTARGMALVWVSKGVALITFVPFTFTVLKLLGRQEAERLVLPVVGMQTIAANLGSMLTPIGNPQNLYLYGKSGLSLRAFLELMLPYTVLSLALLFLWAMILGGRRGKSGSDEKNNSEKGGFGEKRPDGEADLLSGGTLRMLVVYLALFFLCLLSVGRFLPWQAVLAVLFLTVLVTDRKVFLRVDYSLLFTFAGFFVFIGNMGRIPAFRGFLQQIVTGRETLTAILASQAISNVPAALLLSGFSEN